MKTNNVKNRRSGKITSIINQNYKNTEMTHGINGNKKEKDILMADVAR